jgi:hypothetical protein
MKKILAITALVLMSSSAFAQTSTGPAAQSDNMAKPGMHNSMNANAKMMKKHHHMKKTTMMKNNMNGGMGNNGMMNRGGMNNGMMNNGGMNNGKM